MKQKATVARFVLILISLCLPWASSVHAGPEVHVAETPAQQPGERGAEFTPAACPAAPPELPEVQEYDNFCVYYSLPDPVDNPHGTTAAQATEVAGYVQDFWERYTEDFGFLPPRYFNHKLEIYINPQGNSVGACGGNSGWDHINLVSDCFVKPGHMKEIVGHELFHNVQSNYQPDFAQDYYWLSRWIYEGMATTIVDHAFADTDVTPNGLDGGVGFEYDVELYMAATNTDFLDPADRAYFSVVWWKYFAEQFGTTPGEPQLGVDAFLSLWENMLAYRSVAAVNHTLAQIAPGTTFDDAFRQFAVANWTKDLDGLPDASYHYVDDDQAGNPEKWGPVAYHNYGYVESGNAGAAWTNQVINRYGVSYFSAQPGHTCDVVTVSFHRDLPAPTFYHVVTQKGNTFDTHLSGSSTDWTRSFMNDGLTRVMAIAGALDNASQIDVRIACADPTLDVKMPNQEAVARVSPGTKLLAQVLVTDGTLAGPVVAGLTPEHFAATIGQASATVLSGAFVQEQYWLLIQAPAGLDDGTYDLAVTLVDPDSGVTFGSDTNTQSVVYTTDTVDHVLAIDRSGSMGWGTNPRMPAARAAAYLYIDVTRDGDGLAVVPFNGDIAPPPFAIQEVNSTVRTNAKSYVGYLTAEGNTSIGDALQEAVSQRDASPTSNDLCSFVLLSDGMENTALYWSDVQNTVKAAHCPVTSIAFGPESDETLLQEIATATAGPFFYNDVYVSTVGEQLGAETTQVEMVLDLSDTYLYSHGQSEGRSRLMRVSATGSAPSTNEHPVRVDSSVTQVLFAVDWFPEPRMQDPEIALRRPDGTIITPDTLPLTFYDWASGHAGWRIDAPMAGEWQVLVTTYYDYQVLVEAHTPLTLYPLPPGLTGALYTTGQHIPVYAMLSSDRAVTNASVQAWVYAPDGQETHMRLYDDGEHGDGSAGDGLYANLYTRVNQALAEPPSEPGPAPNDEGAYRVRVRAIGSGFEREAMGSFAVLEGVDGDGDRLPDVYEQENGLDDPNADPDADGLSNLEEYNLGTSPIDWDTDDGGEGDGSESDFGQDPLNPSDDQVDVLDPVDFIAGNGVVEIVYHVPAGSDLALYRATDPAGPWSQRAGALPAGGAYQDPATNGVTYYYRVVTSSNGHTGGERRSGPVTPRADPIPPNVMLYIDGGAHSTPDLDVQLSFAPRDAMQDGMADFDDIVDMMLSNDPFFEGAVWEPFAQDVPWTLDAEPATWARVYARFRDDAGNESRTAVGLIFYQTSRVFLPLVVRQR